MPLGGLEEFIVDTARIAGSLSTIGAFIGVIAYKPYKKHKEKQEAAAAVQREKDKKLVSAIDAIEKMEKNSEHMTETLKTIADTVKSNSAAIKEQEGDINDLRKGYLQLEYERLMKAKWATDAAKQAFEEKARPYLQKGYNGLTQKHLDEVFELPSAPPQRAARKRAVQTEAEDAECTSA